MTAHNISATIDTGYLVISCARRFKKVKITVHNPEAAPDTSCKYLTCDPSQIVDTIQLSVERLTVQLWRIQGPIGAVFKNKTLCIVVTSYDLSRLAHPKSHRAECSIGII